MRHIYLTEKNEHNLQIELKLFGHLKEVREGGVGEYIGKYFQKHKITQIWKNTYSAVLLPSLNSVILPCKVKNRPKKRKRFFEMEKY